MRLSDGNNWPLFPSIAFPIKLKISPTAKVVPSTGWIIFGIGGAPISIDREKVSANPSSSTTVK